MCKHVMGYVLEVSTFNLRGLFPDYQLTMNKIQQSQLVYCVIFYIILINFNFILINFHNL